MTRDPHSGERQRDGWANVAAAAAANAQVRDAGLEQFYGDPMLQRTATASARHRLVTMIADELREGVDVYEILDALHAADPTLDAQDAYELLEERESNAQAVAELVEAFVRRLFGEDS